MLTRNHFPLRAALTWWLRAGAAIAPVLPAAGAVQVLAQMRLGEVDTGGSARTSWDSVLPNAGLLPVSDSGLQYSSSSAVNGSTVSIDCSGGGLTGSLVVVPSDNWGIEAWVSGDGDETTGVIAYNGDSGSRGMGLYQHEGYYRGLVGGVAFVGTAAITSQWTHLALVVSGGTTTFYVNGAATASGPPPVPPVSGNALNVGNRRDRAEPLDGRVDEVRIFTFAPGAFSPADLQTGKVQPWPAATSFPSPVASADHQGSIAVSLEPAGNWRLAGEKEWRPGGMSASGLAATVWTIEYRAVPGLIQPAPETVVVTAGSAPILLQRTYAPGATGSATLTTELLPASLSQAGIPSEQRARWRLLGDASAPWMDSGAVLPGMGPGNYLIECSPVPGKLPPPILSVSVFGDETASVTAAYSAPVPAAGGTVVPLPFSTVNGSAEFPLGCLGQLRSDTTTGTGFAVRANVVATAGDVVFDEASLSGVTGLQWLQRLDRGVHEPKPAVPRGYLLLSGYAAQRAAEQTPGLASAGSSGLNAAALYFVGAAGSRGYAGELPELSPSDSLLRTSALKFFAGYPGDIPGVETDAPGRMHAHYSLPVTFSHVSGRTYVTDGFAGLPGGSGGPLFVRFHTGTWHPAAILTGGRSVTTVCALDAEVTQLFNRAKEAGEIFFNPNGGYTISHSLLPGASTNTAGLKVILEPTGLTAGASWMRQQDMVPRHSGTRLLNLAPGTHNVRLSSLAGMIAPGTSQPDGSSILSVVLTGGQLATVTATYHGITAHPVSRFVSPGAAASLSAGASGSPISWQWKFNGVPIPDATSPSWSRNAATSADAGIYSVRVRFPDDVNGEERSFESREAALIVGNTAPLPAWRLAWFGTSTNTGNAADGADPDGDGRSNIDEFAAATDPNAAADFLRVLTATRSDGVFTVTLVGKSGRRYELQRAADPSTGPWAAVTTGVARSDDGTETLRDTSLTAADEYYRVRVSIP